MATAIETPQGHPGHPMPADGHDDHPSSARIVPVHPHPPPTIIHTAAPSPRDDPMDITTPNKSGAASPAHSMHDGSGPNGARDSSKNTSPTSQPHQGGGPMAAPPATAAPAVHQPKIVQTAFIHKLYNMLEDQTIQHLISWSPSADSFVMSPSPDFSKVLAQYFKHTNISSFVRQLNMYGFHKVSDAFHTGNPDMALWEFKHGNGNFKRGDLVGLREIKRRASRHALVHREYPSTKQTSSQPGTPQEPMPPPPPADPSDPRHLEHTLYDLSARLQRSEENAQYMYVKQQTLMESMNRLLYFNQELSRAVLGLAPTSDSPLYRDVVNLQNEMQRQGEMLRALDDPQDAPFSSGRSYLANIENAPVSPRQLPQDDPRRGNLAVPSGRGPAANYYKPPVPSNLSNLTSNSRRPYGSFGASTAPQSPSPLRGQAPPPPPGPHPLSHVEGPGSLARRHTSADIRAHGWQGNPPYPPSGPPPPGPPSAWPPSPGRAVPEEQRIRDSFSNYSFQSASQQRPGSRPATPPPPSNFPNGSGGGGGGPDSFANWSWGSAVNRGSLAVKDSSVPPTRRGSMAHILNPTDIAERDDEDEDPRGEDDRKRKRMQ